MKFVKAHAYGNDFLYIHRSELRGAADPSLQVLAREMCDRHMGIGADGLILYEPTRSGAAMRLLNADGSRAEVSGNGLRGLAALLLRDSDRSDITIETDAGPKLLTRVGRTGTRHTFRAAMGLPEDLVQLPIAAAGESFEIAVMTFGNPQAVVLGPLPDNDRFHRLGRALEHHELFPEGSNIEFAQIESPRSVRILIWERGVGPTLSSGTGSCASLIAASAFGGAERDADVIAPGGSQRVEWNDDSVYLTGWAEVVCEGEWLRDLPR